MSEFNHLPQSPETPSPHDLKIIKALLGDEVAAKYEGAEVKTERTKDAGYKPSEEDINAVHEATENSKEFEKNAENTKRQWMEWADKFSVDKKHIEESANFKENGDVVWVGNFNFSGKGLTELPPNFTLLEGNFICPDNKLTNLVNSPKKVTGNFVCNCNLLTSLKGSPIEVGGDFRCSINKLTSLSSNLKKVGKIFYCDNNMLTNLIGSPEVGESFMCDYNVLTSLEGAPQNLKYNFSCNHNQLRSLEGAPKKVEVFCCRNNQLSSVVKGPTDVARIFDCRKNKDLKDFSTEINVGEDIFVSPDQIELIKNLRKKGYTFQVLI